MDFGLFKLAATRIICFSSSRSPTLFSTRCLKYLPDEEERIFYTHNGRKGTAIPQKQHGRKDRIVVDLSGTSEERNGRKVGKTEGGLHRTKAKLLFLYFRRKEGREKTQRSNRFQSIPTIERERKDWRRCKKDIEW
jgi:hypothetical protein